MARAPLPPRIAYAMLDAMSGKLAASPVNASMRYGLEQQTAMRRGLLEFVKKKTGKDQVPENVLRVVRHADSRYSDLKPPMTVDDYLAATTPILTEYKRQLDDLQVQSLLVGESASSVDDVVDTDKEYRYNYIGERVKL